MHKYTIHNAGSIDTTRTKAVIIWATSTVPDCLRAPVVCDKSIQHNSYGHEAEQRRTQSANAVTEVEQTSGKG